MACTHPETVTRVEGPDTVTRCIAPACGAVLVRRLDQQYALGEHANINDARDATQS